MDEQNEDQRDGTGISALAPLDNVRNSAHVTQTPGLTMRLGARLYQQYVFDCFSARYMQQTFQNSLAVCRKIGWPNLFLMMTCNPFWDEILNIISLLPVSPPEDCLDIIARVFKLKLDKLYDGIKNKDFFGLCKAECQKRGLSHAHMLIWLDGSAKKNLKSDIDSFISAEILDENVDPYGYSVVKQFMIHGSCGLEFDQAPCMKDFKCTRNFPKRELLDQKHVYKTAIAATHQNKVQGGNNIRPLAYFVSSELYYRMDRSITSIGFYKDQFCQRMEIILKKFSPILCQFEQEHKKVMLQCKKLAENFEKFLSYIRGRRMHN